MVWGIARAYNRLNGSSVANIGNPASAPRDCPGMGRPHDHELDQHHQGHAYRRNVQDAIRPEDVSSWESRLDGTQ
jgi:hypothetical protein